MSNIIKSKGHSQLVGQKPRKVGIYSGTFDPVHKGHIAFALEAARAASLDYIYFLPDILPHSKTGVTHYGHRVAMLKLALLPYRSLRILELSDKKFTVAGTLPKLQKLMPHDELHLLLGSDVLESLRGGHWPNSERLLSAVRLIAGVRSGHELERAKQILATIQPHGLAVETERPTASSQKIRDAFRNGDHHQESLESLRAYIAENWLYVALPVASANNS